MGKNGETSIAEMIKKTSISCTFYVEMTCISTDNFVWERNKNHSSK